MRASRKTKFNNANANEKKKRLINTFSKKFSNLQCAIVLHLYYYNFMRVHQSVSVTPLM